MIACSISVCPYYREGVCDKAFVKINKFGQCMALFTSNGRQYSTIDASEARSRITIVEGEWENIDNDEEE